MTRANNSTARGYAHCLNENLYSLEKARET